VQFSEPLSPNAFVPSAFGLTAPNGEEIPLEISLSTDDSLSFHFPAIRAPGVYALRGNIDIQDLAGNKVDQDRDGVSGELGQDEPVDRFTLLAEKPLNTKPTVRSIDDVIVSENESLEFQVTAFDGDEPPQTITFSLMSGYPSGASINPTTGSFTWRLDESSGGGSYPFIVVAIDNGSPPLRAEASFQITVAETNEPPLLADIPDFVALNAVS
jgi:hypothetical protein